MEGRVLLLAEILAAGKGCPVCGGNKTEKARTCRACFVAIGHDATKAVDDLIDATRASVEGHKIASQRSNVRRAIKQTPVLAQFRIYSNATLQTPDGIASFLQMGQAVRGGFLNISVFSAGKEDIGKTITGLVEVKSRIVQGNEIPYLRIEKVGENIISNVKLVIGNNKVGMLNGLPQTEVSGVIKKQNSRPRLIEATVGYVFDENLFASALVNALNN
jgi:hypothetical protein